MFNSDSKLYFWLKAEFATDMHWKKLVKNLL